jgi:hypothetical protein
MNHIEILNGKIRLNILSKIKANLIKFPQKFKYTHKFYK